MDFIKGFHNFKLECQEKKEEKEVVKIRMNSMLFGYRVHLENFNLGMLSQLIEETRRTSLSVKHLIIGKLNVLEEARHFP